ncbi:Rnf-Nqr domain containing protein [Pseudomonas sp. TE3786]
MTAFFLALIGAALVNNLLVLLPAGADAVQAQPARLALLGPASALLIAVATPLGWLLFHGLLLPLQLDYLRLFVYLPLVAALAWLCLRLLRRVRALSVEGLGWPLLVGNGAALGSMLLAETQPFVQALALGVGGGLGFWLALRLLADLLARIDHQAVPAAFRGAPIVLISAGLLGLALLGLQGLAGQ